VPSRATKRKQTRHSSRSRRGEAAPAVCWRKYQGVPLALPLRHASSVASHLPSHLASSTCPSHLKNIFLSRPGQERHGRKISSNKSTTRREHKSMGRRFTPDLCAPRLECRALFFSPAAQVFSASNAIKQHMQPSCCHGFLLREASASAGTSGMRHELAGHPGNKQRGKSC
jgi:hypothetical protein